MELELNLPTSLQEAEDRIDNDCNAIAEHIEKCEGTDAEKELSYEFQRVHVNRTHLLQYIQHLEMLVGNNNGVPESKLTGDYDYSTGKYIE